MRRSTLGTRAAAAFERWRWPIVIVAWLACGGLAWRISSTTGAAPSLIGVPLVLTAWAFGFWGALTTLVLMTGFLAATGLDHPFLRLMGTAVVSLAIVVMRRVADDLRVARAKLAEDERRMRAVLETSFDGFGVHQDGMWVEVSPSLAALLGGSVDEILGKPFWTSIEEGDRTRLAERIGAHRGQPERFHLVRQDGSHLIIESASAETTFRDKPARLVAIRDVTEQERAREALAESEARFRQIAEAIGAVVWLSDIERNEPLYVSPAYERIWGRPLGKLRAAPSSWLDAILPEDRASVQTYLEEHQRGEASVEYRIQRPDGSVRWIHDRAFPVRDASGVPRRVVGIAEDVTTLKSIELQSHRTSTYARTLFESSIDPLATITPDGKIVDVNQAMIVATGLARSALLGRELASFFRDPRAFSDAIADAVKRGVARDELAVLPSGQEERTFLVNATLMDDARSGTRVVLVAARDVTERLRLESEATLQRDAIARQERLSSLGTLVAGVAHEINNPLTYLVGNIELALLDIAEAQSALERGGVRGGPDLAETARGLDAALGGAERIAHITRALKAVSRQRSATAPEDLHLNAVLANVQALLDVATPDGVTLTFAADPSDPVARAPSAEMHQVLLNLVRNALEAVDGHPGSHVWVASRASGEHAEIEVRDDGPGMSPDVQAKLYTPFFTTKPNGTGLGLSIVHSILQEQHGDVVVRSAPGQGTTFVVRLPRVRPASTDEPVSTVAARTNAR